MPYLLSFLYFNSRKVKKQKAGHKLFSVFARREKNYCAQTLLLSQRARELNIPSPKGEGARRAGEGTKKNMIFVEIV